MDTRQVVTSGRHKQAGHLDALQFGEHGEYQAQILGDADKAFRGVGQIHEHAGGLGTGDAERALAGQAFGIARQHPVPPRGISITPFLRNMLLQLNHLSPGHTACRARCWQEIFG
jgi:hypothetical protein